jgi:hypothetical protein
VAVAVVEAGVLVHLEAAGRGAQEAHHPGQVVSTSFGLVEMVTYGTTIGIKTMIVTAVKSKT